MIYLKFIIFFILSLIFTADSVYKFIYTNFNFGTFLTYTITVSFWCYTFFYKPIDVFASYGIGKILKILFFIGIFIVGAIITFLIVMGFAQKAQGNEKCVIVLGAGLRGERVSDILARRLDAAYEFYTENEDIVIVVTGGMGSGETIPEAVAMQRYLIEKGVPSEKIIVEDKSTSTQENFLFAKQLLLDSGFDLSQPIAFSTNHFHCYRSKQYALNAGFSDVSSIASRTGILSLTQAYLREVFAVLYYWVFKMP